MEEVIPIYSLHDSKVVLAGCYIIMTLMIDNSLVAMQLVRCFILRNNI